MQAAPLSLLCSLFSRHFLLYALVEEVECAGRIGGVAVLSQSDLAFSLYLSRWLERCWRAKRYILVLWLTFLVSQFFLSFTLPPL